MGALYLFSIAIVFSALSYACFLAEDAMGQYEEHEDIEF